MASMANKQTSFSRKTEIDPPNLPPPAGSHWEATTSGYWQLARLDAAWRQSVRWLTAVRSLEVGVSSWKFVTDSSFLVWQGRWESRRPEMCCLEVWVDGVRQTLVELQDAAQDTELCLFDAGSRHARTVEIYFPPTTSLTLRSVGIEAGAALLAGQTGYRWCSWGDSITQGTLCPCARDSYVQQAAAQLGWTAMNQGFGGAGFPDPTTALAIARGDPWDILTIAIGINSALVGEATAAEFGEMYRVCLNILAERCPGRPIVCISPVLCTRANTESGDSIDQRTRDITDAIRRIVNDAGHPEIQFVDGRSLLDEAQGLSPDQLHPNPWGHRRIAERLSPILRTAAKKTLR